MRAEGTFTRHNYSMMNETGSLVSTRLQTERANLSLRWSNNRLSTTSGSVTSINKQFILRLQALRMDPN